MRLAVVVALVGCGRVGFDARGHADATITDTPADAAGTARCGGMSLLADTFTPVAPSAQWYSYAHGGITTAQSSGELVIALPATTLASSNYGGYDSVLQYDLRGERVAVEVPQATSPATTAQTDMQLVSASGDDVSIIEEGGVLTASQYIGGVGTTLAMMPYDAGAARWWSFREDAGTLYFETSRDGVSFTAFHSMPAPAFLSLVALVIEAGTYESVMNGGAAHFDNVNGGTPTGMFCPASTLRDDFNSGTVGDQWAGSYTSGGCSYGESSGHLTFGLVTAGGQDCALLSATAFDLTNDAVFTELVAAPGIAETYAALRASLANGDDVEVAIVGTQVECAQSIGGNYTTSCSLPFDAVAHRFLRLRGASGMIAWETSPDGATWTTRGEIASPIALDAVQLSIAAGTNGSAAAASSAVFGTFDVLPP